MIPSTSEQSIDRNSGDTLPDLDTFVVTPHVDDLTRRALSYLASGYPVHFRGPAGTGKTSLALHVAGLLERPTALVGGNESFTATTLLGSDGGYRANSVVDKYVHSVVKSQREVTPMWVDEVLTTACREGYTLVYDEFTRSRPYANNALLTVLEERVLLLPSSNRDGGNSIPVHPEFRAIFTSNPSDYAGVHQTQDALLDRMITIDTDYFDRQTEIRIIAQRSGLSIDDARRIAEMICDYRTSRNLAQTPTLRSGIMIGKIAHDRQWQVSCENPHFVQLCMDILLSKSVNATASENHSQAKSLLTQLLRHYCPPQTLSNAAPPAAND